MFDIRAVQIGYDRRDYAVRTVKLIVIWFSL